MGTNRLPEVAALELAGHMDCEDNTGKASSDERADRANDKNSVRVYPLTVRVRVGRDRS